MDRVSPTDGPVLAAGCGAGAAAFVWGFKARPLANGLYELVAIPAAAERARREPRARGARRNYGCPCPVRR
jgi:hypothetical protein